MHVIGIEEGVIRAQSIKGRPEEMCCDPISVNAIKGTPWRPVPFRFGHAIPTHTSSDVDEDEETDGKTAAADYEELLAIKNI